MSSIDGVSGVPNGPAAPASGIGDLDSDAFLRLLVAQMRYQDPMSPTDHTAMLQQTSQFTQVEALQRVTELQQQLLGLSQARIASDLLGQEVTARDGDGGEVSGIVEAVRFAADGPLLDLGHAQVPLAAATEVSSPTASSTLGEPAASGSDQTWSGPWSHDDSQDADN